MEIKQASDVAVDPEREGGEEFYLDNRSAQSIAWRNVTVKKAGRLKDGKDEQVAILKAINGIAISGELMAIMGPSGCG
ncbi:MAG: hypothetical protein Q9167_006561 [Letrouitia subvulpina]